MTIVTIERVSHQYNQQPILSDISFKVNHGGRLALLGASGSGKTTLLRIIAGIELPQKGRILYDDVPLEDIPSVNRNIGMVFQNYALVPHWKAQRTIGFFMELRKRTEEVPERIRRVASITGVGIEQLLQRTPNKLSGGEQQKVAIARAFTRDLNLLLLDEPFANLDAKIRTTARIELQRLFNEYPITTVMVTHDQHEAAALSDGIVLLRDGRIEQFGEYDHLRNDPDSLYVAQFIGEIPINTFKGRVTDQLWHGTNFSHLPLDTVSRPNNAITMAIRPENVHLQTGGHPARIVQVTPYFSQHMQLLEVENAGETWQIQVPADRAYHVGETVECALDQNKLLFFDSETERRV